MIHSGSQDTLSVWKESHFAKKRIWKEEMVVIFQWDLAICVSCWMIPGESFWLLIQIFEFEAVWTEGVDHSLCHPWGGCCIHTSASLISSLSSMLSTVRHPWLMLSYKPGSSLTRSFSELNRLILSDR